jgi:hypothetical protein
LLTGFDILVNLKVAPRLGLLNWPKLGQVLIVEGVKHYDHRASVRSELVEEKEASVCFPLPEDKGSCWKARK